MRLSLRLHPYDLGATVYPALGIDPAMRYRDALDRPRGLAEQEAPVVGAF